MFRNPEAIRSLVTAIILAFAVTLPACRTADNSTPAGNRSGQQETAPPPVKEVDRPQLARLRSPYTGVPAVWIDGVPYPAEQIDRYLKTMVAPGHLTASHQGTGSDRTIDLFQAVDSFARFVGVVREGVRLGLEDDPRFKYAFDVHQLSVLGEDYLKHLVTSAPLDPDAVKARLPYDWVRMNFELKVLPPDLDPQEVRKPGTEAEWLNLPWIPLTGDPARIPDTGPVFPYSGFFDREIDAHLFTLEEGEIDGPFRTGVGEAFIRVKEKQILSPDEIEAEITKIREFMSEAYRDQQLKEARLEMREFIDRETYERCAWEEVESGRQLDEVVFSHGDLKLSYPVFRSQDSFNLDFNAELSTPNVAVGQLGLRLEYFVARLDLGRRALAEGFEPDPKWRKAIYDHYLRSLFSLTMETLEESFREAADWPTRDMALNFYEERKADRYRVPGQARVTYLQSPSRDQLDGLKRDLDRGLFTMDTVPTGRMISSPHGRQRLRRGVVLEGGELLEEIQGGIFAMAEGEVKVLSGRSQSYLVRLDSLETGGLLPFDQVADQVEADLHRLTWATRMNERLAEIYDALDVRYRDPALQEPEGKSAPGLMDRI